MVNSQNALSSPRKKSVAPPPISFVLVISGRERYHSCDSRGGFASALISLRSGTGHSATDGAYRWWTLTRIRQSASAGTANRGQLGRFPASQMLERTPLGTGREAVRVQVRRLALHHFSGQHLVLTDHLLPADTPARSSNSGTCERPWPQSRSPPGVTCRRRQCM